MASVKSSAKSAVAKKTEVKIEPITALTFDAEKIQFEARKQYVYKNPGIPPTFVAITGNPQAMASKITVGKVSAFVA